jgi:hypothetical protein
MTSTGDGVEVGGRGGNAEKCKRLPEEARRISANQNQSEVTCKKPTTWKSISAWGRWPRTFFLALCCEDAWFMDCLSESRNYDSIANFCIGRKASYNNTNFELNLDNGMVGPEFKYHGISTNRND